MFDAISTVFLVVADLAASRRFYSEQLGLAEVSAKQDHVRYRVGNQFLVIHGPLPDSVFTAWNMPPARDPRGTGVVLTLRCADVDAAHAELLARGVQPLGPPCDAAWGARMFLLADPSGYVLEVSRPGR
ncbi:MAG TPA: VOC family protein [Gammaproteobacteria bacterium]